MDIPATVVLYVGDGTFERCYVMFGGANQIGGLAAYIVQTDGGVPQLRMGILYMTGETESPTILEDFTIIDSMAQEVRFTFSY